jgi:hypothetical protein
MPVSDQDVELLETYLDGELTDADAATIDRRLSGEPALSARLDEMRQQRQHRRLAMSMVYRTDADAVDRLVMAVRTARATEAIATRRSSFWRYTGAAAASLLLGLMIGSLLGRSGNVDAPLATNVNHASGMISNVSFDGSSQGTFVVALRDPASGQIVHRIMFPTRAAAEAWIARMTQLQSGQIAVDPSPAIASEPY